MHSSNSCKHSIWFLVLFYDCIHFDVIMNVPSIAPIHTQYSVFSLQSSVLSQSNIYEVYTYKYTERHKSSRTFFTIPKMKNVTEQLNKIQVHVTPKNEIGRNRTKRNETNWGRKKKQKQEKLLWKICRNICDKHTIEPHEVLKFMEFGVFYLSINNRSRHFTCN